MIPLAKQRSCSEIEKLTMLQTKIAFVLGFANKEPINQSIDLFIQVLYIYHDIVSTIVSTTNAS